MNLEFQRSDEDDPLIAYHEALMAGESPGTDLSRSLPTGADKCLKLLERLRRQSSSGDAEWLFGERSAQDGGHDGSSLAAQGESAPALPERIGRFQIERRIGEGGFGVVFLAVDPLLGRRVALKLPRPEAMVSRSWQSRFLREAEAAALLHHPRIVPVYEVGQAGSLCYIVQAWCDGISLDRWLAVHQQCNRVTAAAELVATLAEAVQHAHSRGVLHRDIKPSNVLLECPSESTAGDEQLPEADQVARRIAEPQLAQTARLADFGLARLVERGAEQTQSGAVIGTPSYMAPEQAEGRLADMSAATDVYSLGAVLYELLTGQPPLREATMLATLQAVREREPPRVRSLRSDVPIDLEAICLKCLEKDPKRRYAAAGLLADDLRRYLRGEVVSARRTSSAERLARWCRRRPVHALLVLAVAILVTALVAGSFVSAAMLARKTRAVEASLSSAIKARNNAARNENIALSAVYSARLAEARAARQTGLMGQRRESLSALAGAAQLLPRLGLDVAHRLTLRREALASLQLLDAIPEGACLADTAPGSPLAMDPQATRCAYVASDSSGIEICAYGSRRALRRLRFSDTCSDAASVQFSPDGDCLAAVYMRPDRTTIADIWSLTEELPPASLEVISGRSQAVDFSADGQWLGVAKPDGEVALLQRSSLWRPDESPQVARTFKAELAAWTLRFDARSERMAIYRLGRVELVELDSGQRQFSMPVPTFIHQLDFSADGHLMAAACEDKLVRLWDVSSGLYLGSLGGHTDVVDRVFFHPQENLLASSSIDRRTILWSVEPFHRRLELQEAVHGFSSDGRFLGAGTERLRFEVPREYKAIALPHLPTSVSSRADRLSVDRTGRVLVAANPHQCVLIDLEQQRVVASVPMSGGDACFSDGALLVSTRTQGLMHVPIREHDSAQARQMIIGPAQPGDKQGGSSLASSRDGRVVALLHHDLQPQIRIHRSSDKSPLVLRPHHQHAKWLDLSRDGRWLATGTQGGRDVRVWDTDSGRCLRVLLAGQARALFSPDGGRLAVDEGRQISLWDTQTWDLVARVPRTIATSPGPLAFSSDGQWLALADPAWQVKLLDGTSLEEVGTLPTDRKNIDAIAFSPDGARLIAASSTPGTIHVWDLRRLNEQLAAVGLEFSPAAGGVGPPALAGSGSKPSALQVDLSAIAPLPLESASEWLRAVDKLSERIAQRPDHAQAYWQRAQQRVFLRQCELAVADCTRALQLQPGLQDALFWRARAYQESGRYAEAIADFERSLELRPEDAWCCRHLAWLYSLGPDELRQPERALALARRAIASLNPRSARFLHTHLTTLAMAHYRSGEIDEALETLQRARESYAAAEPNCLISLLESMCYQQLGQPDRARRSYDAALSWDERRPNFDPQSFIRLRAEAAHLLGLK